MATPSASYTVQPIGWVRSALTHRADAPRQGDEGAPDAQLEIEPAFRRGAVHPRDDLTRPLAGVFATRSPDRPNPIGLHRVKVLAVEPDRSLHVHGLEAIDGTPVIDIKPVLPRVGGGDGRTHAG